MCLTRTWRNKGVFYFRLLGFGPVTCSEIFPPLPWVTLWTLSIKFVQYGLTWMCNWWRWLHVLSIFILFTLGLFYNMHNRLIFFWYLHSASLRRVDPSSRGVLPSAVCVNVISKPQQWGRSRAVAPQKKKFCPSVCVFSTLHTRIS